MFEIKKVNDSNQITIPKKLCVTLGIKQNDYVVFTTNNKGLVVMQKFDPRDDLHILMVDDSPSYSVNVRDTKEVENAGSITADSDKKG